MITEHEINTVKLDPLKKDFYQIWNELLDTAKKISDRWDPTSTNEADPGIVLLKVLTAVADKLNYNIDKNILEGYFPSATQEESVRKLCDMLGYSMKYYRSATTPLTISYTGKKSNIGTADKTSQIQIPKYTVITNADDDISYILTQPVTFNDPNMLTKQVEAIEGMKEDCQVNDNKIITLSNLDDNKRFYFPETQIAENGIFIHNVIYTATEENGTEAAEGEPWVQVDNLNTQKINSKVFKFGYDSLEKLPYVQFPEDVANVIEDGILIKYLRTNGVNGNIAARTLNKFQTIDDIIVNKNNDEAEDLDLENELLVTNASSAMNGSNKESIDSAYNNYKRTIGTFDTLVTCRDYMNKIYQMMQKDLAPDVSMDTTPLVSNIIVSDIRDDINSSYVLCTFDSNGINYVDMTKTTVDDQDQVIPLINNFDLKLYPFTTISNMTSKSEYDNSFKYSGLNISNIIELLKDNKTISHTYKIPAATEVACIKIYLRLNCKITTNYKITRTEESVILKNIYASLYDAFNMRQLEFGEEIPYDSILDVIKNADTRIKNISLDEPVPYVKFAMVSGEEYDIDTESGREIYNQLALRNVLAGKIALFNYNENFKTELTETKAAGSDYNNVYYGGTEATNQIRTLTADFTLNNIPTSLGADGYTLQDNEVIQFMAPNLRTVLTYPAYVNYYLKLNRTEQDDEEDENQQVNTPTGYSTKKIEKNTDYRLQSGEYLYINYTPASDSGDDASPENVTYSEGDIIRFNFDVYDSKSWKEGYWRTGSYNVIDTHSYAKTSGYTAPVDGMFCFGAKEQVEIRELSEIQLGSDDENLVYVYWQRNDDNDESNTSDTIEFKFDDDGSYTLKEGEYFYYTDINKLDMAIYGNGTKITKYGAITLKKDKVTEDLTSEDILLQGLAASIPWVSVAVDATDKYLKLQEFQYITLTSGDILKEIVFKDSSQTSISYISKEVNSAKYKFMSNSSDSVLPSIAVGTTKWEVKSKLDINMGPTTSQILHINDKITATYKDRSHKDFKPDETNNPTLTLKSNYPVVSSSRETDVTIWKLDEETGTYVDTYSDFKIKVFKNQELINNNVLHNFSADFSKISLNEISGLENPLVEQLNILIPENNTGLIMFYYTLGEHDETTDKPYTYLTFEGTGDATIFNNIVSGDESWWNGSDYKSGSKDNDKYYLRDGINIIHLPQTITSIQINTDKHSEEQGHESEFIGANDIIIFGNLDLIETNKELNPKIQYNAQDAGSDYKNILQDINAIDTDHNFYYNTILDNSSMIDLNENNSDETLDNPYTWYNYNNVNNKFVITEIDSNYLSTGITIAKSSKL